VSRFAFMLDRPRRTLAALATILAATSLTVASGADFTAESASPLNTFATGTLTISNSKANAAILSAGGMRPGDPAVSGTVDIANSGSLSGAFTLTRSAPQDSDETNPLSSRLHLLIRDCGAFVDGTAPACGAGAGTLVYDGTLAAMTDAKALGTFAGGEKRRFRFETTVDPTAGNEYQGDASQTEFTWTAA
jgi:spore coat-associated protein N